MEAISVQIQAILVPLFSGKAFYPPGKRVLDEESSFSDLGLRPHHALEPTVQSYSRTTLFARRKLQGLLALQGGEISSVGNLPFTVVIGGLQI